MTFTNQKIITLAAILFFCSNCNSSQPVDSNLPEGESCNNSQECKTGLVCFRQQCRVICQTDEQCDQRSQHCDNGVCLQGSNIVCGNNKVELGENCDDGNNTPGDGCDANCNIENFFTCTTGASGASVCSAICGDNYIVKGYEECDDGTNALNGNCPNCKKARCGDGTVKTTGADGIIEECDDGNNIDGDGCDANCQIESHFYCQTDENGRSICECGDHRQLLDGRCQECLTGYFGNDCLPCPGLDAGSEICGGLAECNDGNSGDGSCLCPVNRQGRLCGDCASGFYGPNCQPCNCLQSQICDEGIDGNGECIYPEDYYGLVCPPGLQNDMLLNINQSSDEVKDDTIAMKCYQRCEATSCYQKDYAICMHPDISGLDAQLECLALTETCRLFIDGDNGNDNYPGTRWEQPLKTFTGAMAKMPNLSADCQGIAIWMTAGDYTLEKIDDSILEASKQPVNIFVYGGFSPDHEASLSKRPTPIRHTVFNIPAAADNGDFLLTINYLNQLSFNNIDFINREDNNTGLILMTKGLLTMDDCLVDGFKRADKSENSYTGIVTVRDNAKMLANNTTFNNNSVTAATIGWGGAILSAGSLYINNCRFIGNQMIGETFAGGAAVMCFTESPVFISNTIFEHNSALVTAQQDVEAQGGAVLIATSNSFFGQNLQFSNNSTIYSGGYDLEEALTGSAIYILGDLGSLINCTFYNNTNGGYGGHTLHWKANSSGSEYYEVQLLYNIFIENTDAHRNYQNINPDIPATVFQNNYYDYLNSDEKISTYLSDNFYHLEYFPLLQILYENTQQVIPDLAQYPDLPTINDGFTYSSMNRFDLNGKERPQNFTPGAYEASLYQ